MTSRELNDEVEKSEIKASIISDHSAMTMRIKSDCYEKKGPGYWKFNSKLIYDKEFCEQLEENLNIFRGEFRDIEDKRLLWDLLKWRIRIFASKYSKKKIKQERENEKSLEQEINDLEELMNKCQTGYEDLMKRYEELKNMIKEISESKEEKELIKSKAMWAEEGERSTRYFLGEQRSRSMNKTLVPRINSCPESEVWRQ